jgi:hypothetical protein
MFSRGGEGANALEHRSLASAGSAAIELIRALEIDIEGFGLLHQAVQGLTAVESVAYYDAAPPFRPYFPGEIDENVLPHRRFRVGECHRRPAGAPPLPHQLPCSAFPIPRRISQGRIDQMIVLAEIAGKIASELCQGEGAAAGIIVIQGLFFHRVNLGTDDFP